jgi:hypothetical protein
MTNDGASTTTGPRLGAYALRNPAIVISAFYLLTSVIGMVVAYAKFREYGIHVFDWWEPSDFFLAAFREPWSFAIAAFATGYAFLVSWGNRRQQARIAARRASGVEATAFGFSTPRWLHRYEEFIADWQYRHRMALSVSFGIGIFVMIAWLFAQHSLMRSRLADPGSLDSRAVRVVFVAALDAGGSTSLESYLLGTSNRFLFLGSEPHGGKITVVPSSSVIAVHQLAQGQKP